MHPTPPHASITVILKLAIPLWSLINPKHYQRTFKSFLSLNYVIPKLVCLCKTNPPKDEGFSMPCLQFNLWWCGESSAQASTEGRWVTLTYIRCEQAKQKLHQLKLHCWKKISGGMKVSALSIYLSVRLYWDKPTKLLSEKTVPSRKVSCISHSYEWCWDVKRYDLIPTLI